jgi:hypothetical protein
VPGLSAASVIGLRVAARTTHLLESLLFGLRPNDPLVLGGAVVTKLDSMVADLGSNAGRRVGAPGRRPSARGGQRAGRISGTA